MKRVGFRNLIVTHLAQSYFRSSRELASLPNPVPDPYLAKPYWEIPTLGGSHRNED
jgi:hypothetical protein